MSYRLPAILRNVRYAAAAQSTIPFHCFFISSDLALKTSDFICGSVRSHSSQINLGVITNIQRTCFPFNFSITAYQRIMQHHVA